MGSLWKPHQNGKFMVLDRPNRLGGKTRKAQQSPRQRNFSFVSNKYRVPYVIDTGESPMSLNLQFSKRNEKPT